MMRTIALILAVFYCSTAFAAGGDVCMKTYGVYDKRIIGYHNCDALGNLTVAGGDPTVTYHPNILLETASPIMGYGSWDNNNASGASVCFNITGNIDFDSGQLGFYFRPQEIFYGYILYTNKSNDFYIRYDNYGTARMVLYWRGVGSRVYNTDSIAVGNTSYISCKFNGNTCTLYLDGVEKITLTGTAPMSSTTISFFALDGNAWDSHIDQIISSNDPTQDVYALRDTIFVPQPKKTMLTLRGDGDEHALAINLK